MAHPKALLLADLRSRIQAHQHTVMDSFRPLDEAILTQIPAWGEWSILQCFDHLNQTHAYYNAKIGPALETPVQARSHNDTDRDTDRNADRYAPSFWGRIYMFFAFNPRFSFPAAAEIAPAAAPPADTFSRYLHNQTALLRVLDAVADVDLSRTRIPIKRGVSFNLGDCLKILVYHDALHIDQATRVREKVTPT